MNNFKGTHIPDIDNINSGINNKLDSVKTYKIQNFYTDTDNKIYKNTEGIKKIIDYNSFLNKNSNSKNELKGLYIQLIIKLMLEFHVQFFVVLSSIFMGKTIMNQLWYI